MNHGMMTGKIGLNSRLMNDKVGRLKCLFGKHTFDERWFNREYHPLLCCKYCHLSWADWLWDAQYFKRKK